jgi:hypothetical protein
MLGDLAKKVVNLAVVLLAAVTFFLVPFGKHTLFGHLKAVFTTREAGELGHEVKRTSQRVVDEVKGEVVPRSAAPSVAPHPAGH